MPILEAWTNDFASSGKRTTGTAAGHFANTGPGWRGTLPDGVQELKSPTRMVWMIARTQTNGPSEYAAVHAIQKQYVLTPLSSFGKPWTPPAEDAPVLAKRARSASSLARRSIRAASIWRSRRGSSERCPSP